MFIAKKFDLAVFLWGWLIKLLGTTSFVVSVRRGEFANDPKYKKLIGTPDLSYYYSAIEQIANKISKPFFYIFSDDPLWVEKKFKIKHQYQIIDWNKGEKSWRDMQLMSLCKHNIISNSTFSWWGAWLNNNNSKIVITPEHWFKGEFAHTYKTTDLLPDSWIKL
jgi:hypothetical protein